MWSDLMRRPAQLHESSFDFITNYDVMMAVPGMTVSDFDADATTTFILLVQRASQRRCIFTRQLVLHTMGLLAGLGPIEIKPAAMAIYMPITPMFMYAWDLCGNAVLKGFMSL